MPLLQLQPETQYVPTGMYDITQFPANSFVVKYIDPVSGNVGKAAVMSTVSGGTTTYSILIGNTQYQLAGYQTHYADVYVGGGWLTADICDPADTNGNSIDLVANPTYQWHDSFGNAKTGLIQSRDVYITAMNALFRSYTGDAVKILPSSASYPKYSTTPLGGGTGSSGWGLFSTFLYNGQTVSGPCPGLTTYGGWPATTYNNITYSILGFAVTTTPNLTFPWKSGLPVKNVFNGGYSTYGQYTTENGSKHSGAIRLTATGYGS